MKWQQLFQQGQLLLPPATFYKVPVAFVWALDNYVDDAETTAAIAQATNTTYVGEYYLKLTGSATLTQID